MSDFPKFVEFREEGPREGFQIEKTIHPIEQRAELIDLLGETGLKRIMVGSFVSRKWPIPANCLPVSNASPVSNIRPCG